MPRHRWNEPRFSGWNIFLSIPSDWPPGMYDAIALTRDPARRLVQPNAARIARLDVQPTSSILNAVPYWSARVGRPLQIGIDPGPIARREDTASRRDRRER